MAPPASDSLILPGDPAFNLHQRKPKKYQLASVKGLVRVGRLYFLELRDPHEDDPGQLNLHGGKLRRGEFIDKAFGRELGEETLLRKVPLKRIEYLTHFDSVRPEGLKLNVMVFYHHLDGRVDQGDGGKPIAFSCAREMFEDPLMLPWLKPKTEMVVMRSLAAGKIPWDTPLDRPVVKQLAATRRALLTRELLTTEYLEYQPS